MSIFQTCFFIVQIIFYLTLGLVVALFPERLFGVGKYTSYKKQRYSYLEGTSLIRSGGRRQISRWKIIWFTIVMSITVYLIKPYILDIPQLITGKFNYVIGEVQDIRTVSKDPIQYVYISGGHEVEFFFSSGVSEYKNYKIGYLTHTKRAIYCEQIDENNGHRNAVGFPYKDIVSYLAIIGALILIAFISPFVRLRLFIPVNIISFLGFTYFFIKYGLDNGIWIASENRGFFSLIFTLVSLFITISLYFIEKWKDGENYATFFCAQLFSICDIGLLICIVFNLE